MDMTEAPTGLIVAGSHTATKDAINVYLPTQEMNQQSTTDCRLGSPVSDNMEITETVSSHFLKKLSFTYSLKYSKIWPL